jgi:glycosyltransferase involved in cell wall biosynthesis
MAVSDNVSVCLATYNGAAYLADQVSSILDQLIDGDELIIADDGSTDGTAEVLLRYGPAVRVVGFDRVGGVVQNFERILASARCELIILSDQDDVWLPGRVELIRESLQQCDLVVLNGEVVDADLNPRGMTVFEAVKVRRGFLRNLLKNSFIGCCMAFRREVLDRVLPFPALVPWHDWYIGLVAELYFRVRRVDVITLLYRRHGANVSTTGERSKNSFLKVIVMRLAILRAVLIVSARHVKFQIRRL